MKSYNETIMVGTNTLTDNCVYITNIRVYIKLFESANSREHVS